MNRLDAFSAAVDAEIDNTKRELTDIMNVDSPLRDRVRNERGMDGIQRAVHAIIRLQTRMHAVKAKAALATTGGLSVSRAVAESILDEAKDHAVEGKVRLTELIHIANAVVGWTTAELMDRIKAEVIRDLARAQREIAHNSQTKDGRFEAEGIADWLDERANLTDPRRLEGAHP